MAANGNFAVPLTINGKDIVTKTTFPVNNPGTSKEQWASSSASPDDARAAIDAATAALPGWSKTKPSHRRDLFLRAADVLERRREEFGGYMEHETGAGKMFIGLNTHVAAEMLRDIAGRIVGALSGHIPVCGEQGTSALVVKEPYGVVLAIAPWNAPYILGIRSVAYALAAGNTTVLKGSELSPRCMWAIGSVFRDAGLPDGCLNVVYNRREDAAEITNLLIEHPAIKKVNFTGSTAVGSIVASLAGKHLKPCLMELGGKASAIVLDDADLGKAATQCVLGAFLHSGQICMSTERIVVQSSIVEPFTAALKQAAANIFPDSGEAPILIQAAGVEKNKKLVNDALSKGAKLVHGGVEDTEGLSEHRLRPIIVSGVTKDMDIHGTESFGPSVSLIEVQNDEEAVELANFTDYGLTGAVFTENLQRGLNVAKRIESGAIHINAMSVHDEPNLPHGGTKKSGWGRFNSNFGLDEFLRTKTITFQGVDL